MNRIYRLIAEATDETLDRVLSRALSLTTQPILVRMDASFHSKTSRYTGPLCR
jgi:hypothetical protein